MNNNAYIGLGSNLDRRYVNLEIALTKLSEDEKISIIEASPVYESKPSGGPPQGDFLNACIKVRTGLSPVSLLRVMLNIEESMGRVRNIKWGPRNIDLDLLIYENIILNTPFLTLPHPHLTKRDFVIIPLSDIAHNLSIPGKKITVGALAEIFYSQKPKIKKLTSFKLKYHLQNQGKQMI